ncbi:MAG TPA: hypothetical protein VMH80_08070 [Bryobacteraceae bacterium]|nr:hypothetical protein [Bryobacteraceae bacterium]
MDAFKNSLAYWTTILGAVTAFLGLIQSFSWLAGIGILLLAVSIIAVAYGTKQRELLNRAALRLEGRSLDSLNVANLRRRVNQDLVIQETRNWATIRGEDLSVRWECSGYCRAERASAMEFSIDSDNNVPFGELQCFAYDLHNDPERKHRIRSILIGPDGISKKVAVPFLEVIAAQEPFKIELLYELPGCMKAEVEYYSASLSFQQQRLHRFWVELTFEDGRPEWVRVYDCGSLGAPRLLRDLAPITAEGERYQDRAEDVSAHSQRVYFFRRDRY